MASHSPVGSGTQAHSLGGSPRSRHCIRPRGDKTARLPSNLAPHAVSTAGFCSPRSALCIFAGHSGSHSSRTRGKATTLSLPREGVPYNDQAVGPSVGRGDPPPVLADAETGDHVRVALQKWGENTLKDRGCGPAVVSTGRAGAPQREPSPFQAHLAGDSTPASTP